MRIMKKTFSLILYFLLAATLMTACKNEKTATVGDEKKEAETLDETQREIFCWGDSLTEGYGVSEAEIFKDDAPFDASYLSYPDILQQLTGITTYNLGVFGATSEEIAIMQGGITPERDMGSYDIIDYNIMEQTINNKNSILVLEIGSNGGWDGDYATLIYQYNAMIAYSGCNDYIIIGDTDDPENSIDESVAQTVVDNADNYIGTNETSWETALREGFGEHFINMRVFMIENGLNVAGLKATDEDNEAAKIGDISVQLRSDWTHFNSYGYYVQAVGVYQKGLQLGYWN